MSAQLPTQPLDRIRSALREARRMAVEASPQALDRCEQSLKQIRAGLEESGAPAEAIVRFRHELAQLALLLENAARFYLGWMQLKGVLVGGYNAGGLPAEMEPDRRLSVEG